jgi:hypothetical protein
MTVPVSRALARRLTARLADSSGWRKSETSTRNSWIPPRPVVKSRHLGREMVPAAERAERGRSLATGPKALSFFAMLAGLALATGMTASVAAGQSVWSSGVSVSGNLVLGRGGSDFLDSGFGLDATVARRATPHLAIRMDGLLVRLSPSSSTAGGRNTILALGVGPEANLSLSALELYARLLLGAATNIRGGAGSPGGEGTNWASALGGGVGLRLTVSRSVALDLGGDILLLGELGFVGSAVSSFQFTSQPAVLRLRLGLRIGVT